MADIVIMPKLGFDMAEGVLVRWVKSEGDAVEKGELLAEIETDKATVEVESTHAGNVRRHLVEEGAVVPVGDAIAVIAPAEEEIDWDSLLASTGADQEDGAAAGSAEPTQLQAEQQPSAAAERVPAPSDNGAGLPGGVRASPLARRMAEDRNIDLKAVQGTGPGGRITKRDIEAFAERPIAAAAPSAGVVLTEPREDQLVPLTRLRAAIGRRMTESKQQFPHFYVTHEFDMAPVMAVRSQLNAMLEEEGVKLSVNDFIVKAAALALRDFPNLNASLEDNRVRQYGHINIGNAVAVDNGLLTVVCHDADFKSLRQISVEVREKAIRAREGKVHPDDIEGSTFTLSNLGMFDVEDFIAIINPPEAAILAIGSARQVPVVEDGEITIGNRMKATISVDHRVSDGAEAARFMQTLAQFLEQPLRFML